MKISRKQLRKIIQEAMFDPHGTFAGTKSRFDNLDYLDDETKSKAHALTKLPDKEDQRQGYQAIETLGGYESSSDDYDYDATEHDKEMKLAGAENQIEKYMGNIKPFLDQGSWQKLSSAAGKELQLYNRRGFNFLDTTGPEEIHNYGITLIGSTDIYSMTVKIATKNPNAKVHHKTWKDSMTSIMHSLVQTIIMLSKETHADADSLVELGIGDYGVGANFKIWDSKLKAAHQAGKLIIFDIDTDETINVV